MVDAALYSSASTLWQTPPEIFDPLHRQFRFTLDVCATDAAAARVPAFIDPATDALDSAVRWSGRCWMNPPCSRRGGGIGAWLEKAVREVHVFRTADLVCALIPARTDTRYWHQYAAHGHVCLLQGRIRFLGDDGQGRHGAPFPSALVLFERQGRRWPCLGRPILQLQSGGDHD